MFSDMERHCRHTSLFDMFCGTAAAALPLCFAALPLRHCRYVLRRHCRYVCGTAAMCCGTALLFSRADNE